MRGVSQQMAVEGEPLACHASISSCENSKLLPRRFEPSAYFGWQPIFGWCVAALIAPVILPVVALLVLLVRVTSQGPGIYRQLRVGKNGKLFWIYKIRTMRIDAERDTGPVWTAENDPRVTPLGRLLRRFHLDELPQIINVLKGEMTLVGPRPERPEFCQVLASAIPGYMFRHTVLPGITGLAQINLPPDTDLDSVRRKLVLDLEYIEAGHFWLDMRILLCTGLKLIGFPGLKLAGWLGLIRNVQIPDWMKNGQQPPDRPLTFSEAIQHHIPSQHQVLAHVFSQQSFVNIRKPR